MVLKNKANLLKKRQRLDKTRWKPRKRRMLNLDGNTSMQSTCDGECIAKKESVLRNGTRGQNRDRTFCQSLAIRWQYSTFLFETN